jgi:carbon monoxide dehydrogenase subunit G
MNFRGELSVKAPREQVFEKLKEAHFFASCVEGVRDLDELSPNRYAAIFVTKLAYISFKFAVEVEMTRIESPSRIEAKVEGKPLGIVGRLSATASTTLTENADETLISYNIDATLTGKLGAVGQPVMKSKAKEMEVIFVKNLRSAFGQ